MTQETAFLKESPVTVHKTSHCRILEGNVLRIKVRCIDVAGGRAGGGHLRAQSIQLAGISVIRNHGSGLTDKRDIDFACRNNQLLFIHTRAH